MESHFTEISAQLSSSGLITSLYKKCEYYKLVQLNWINFEELPVRLERAFGKDMTTDRSVRGREKKL